MPRRAAIELTEALLADYAARAAVARRRLLLVWAVLIPLVIVGRWAGQALLATRPSSWAGFSVAILPLLAVVLVLLPLLMWATTRTRALRLTPEQKREAAARVLTPNQQLLDGLLVAGLGLAMLLLNPGLGFWAHSALLAFTLGILLIMHAAIVRHRTPPSCARCRYSLDAFDEVPGFCPECGVTLEFPGAVADIARPRRPGVLVLGIALLLIPVTGMIAAWTASRPLAAFAPTPVLRVLSTSSSAAFAELISRPMTDEQRSLLTLTPDRPGVLRVSARLVLCTGDIRTVLRALEPVVQWKDDGSFTLLPDVPWHEQRWLEAEVLVEPQG